MASLRPAYYTTLPAFARWFTEGLPILTYHKVGPRPWGARLRGLYVSPRLFRRQVAELRAAGYTSSSLADLLQPGAVPRIVFTFDDGFANVFENALAPLASARFTAIQFLVADRIGGRNEWEMAEGEVAERLMDAAQVRAWLAAGHSIGSHTCTHPYLTQIPPAAAREELTASRKKLEDMFGTPVVDFCYPYGDHNPEVVDLVRGAGYRTACTTVTGLNTLETPRHELRRITVRYRSRRLKDLFAAWRRS